ncbi:MAG TPA: alpha/beta hydrolase, partial [Rummeliibacillus sp.]|nr:alpha/beta hydrolase [Rummeliibacillus sp.]
RDEKIELELELQTISVPTLIIHGTHDQVIPFSQAIILNDKIEGSRLVAFQYSGHGPFWEEREKFNEVLINFTSH